MKKSITILEDDRDIREICTLLLCSEGYLVHTYPTVAALYSSDMHANLFLLDIQLPDGNGLEVCEKIKASKRYANTPVIIMSANLGQQTMLSASRADVFIEKPFDINRLINTVATLIH